MDEFYAPEEYQAERAVWERVGGRDFDQPEELRIPLGIEEKTLLIAREKLSHYLTLLNKRIPGQVSELLSEIEEIPRIEYYNIEALCGAIIFKNQRYPTTRKNIQRISTLFDISSYDLYRYLRFYDTLEEFPR